MIRALALVLALALPGHAFAQEFSPALQKSTPEERAAIQTDYMKEKLGLSAEQLPKVQAINLDTAKQMEPILKGEMGPLQKLRAAREIEQTKEAALQKVFTPEQFQTFLTAREELRQKLEQRLLEKAAGSGS